MAIHHAQIKSAEAMGYQLEEKSPHVRAFMPSTGVAVFGVSAKDAMNQMIAFQNILKRNAALRYRIGEHKTAGWLEDTDNDTLSEGDHTPVELYRNYDKLHWSHRGEHTEPEGAGDGDGVTDPFETSGPDGAADTAPLVKRSEAGVALDGAVAYAEGIMAADNPFEEGTDEANEWDAQWDQAADDAPESHEKGGSVVAGKYRAIYAERGHPTHSGDELAVLLNSYCVGKKSTDLAVFERICNANGVDTSKYNRTTPGWQGRIRMTGRNLLAKRVYAADGKVSVPDRDNPDVDMVITLSADWIAHQRFTSKPKGE